MPPHPYEYHFVTPPTTPKRRSPPLDPSRDGDTSPSPSLTSPSLTSPPNLSRNIKPPSLSYSASISSEVENDTTTISNSQSDVTPAAPTPSSSPNKTIPSSPRGSRVLTEKRRRKVLEHRRNRSVASLSDSVTNGSSRNVNGVGNIINATDAKSPERGENASSSESGGSPSSFKSAVSNEEDLASANDVSGGSAPRNANNSSSNSEEIIQLQNTIRLLEQTLSTRDTEAAQQARNTELLQSKIEEQSKQLSKKKTQIKELEDMVIWSETTLATKLEELKTKNKEKSFQVVELNAQLASVTALKDAKMVEVAELKSWKMEAQSELEEVERHCQEVVRENSEWRGKYLNMEESLQAKLRECTVLSEKFKGQSDQITKLNAEHVSKEEEWNTLRREMEEKITMHESTIASLHIDMANNAKSFSETISELKSNLLTKTDQYEKSLQEVSNYKGHLTEATDEISQLCTKLHNRKTEVVELQKRISESEEGYERTVAAMAENGAREMERCEEKIRLLEEEVDVKDGKVEELEKTLEGVREDLGLKLQMKEGECVDLKKDGEDKVREYDAIISGMKEEAEKEKQVSSERIEKLESDLATMCGDVAALENSLKSAAKDVDESQLKIDELEKELTALQG